VFVVVVTGPPGAGKSELAAAVHDSLGDDGIANALVELDELKRCYPPLGEQRALSHLGMLCGSFRGTRWSTPSVRRSPQRRQA